MQEAKQLNSKQAYKYDKSLIYRYIFSSIIFISIAFAVHNLSFAQSLGESSYIIKLKSSDKFTHLLSTNKQFLKPIFSNNNSNKENNLLYSVRKELNLYYRIDNISQLTKNELDELISSAEFIEPNYKYKIEQDNTALSDELYSKQWGLSAVNAPKSWQIATGKGIIVGVVDTGIDFEHPDLVNQLWINPKEDLNANGTFEPWSYKEARIGIYGDMDGIDNDDNGATDDVIGYDFVDQELSNPAEAKYHDGIPTDEHSHGTIVSGVISAKANNKIGIAGVAYEAKIMTARAFDASGNAESDDISKAIIYLADNGAKVINCSFGEQFYSRLSEAAIRYATRLGVVVVASSGNNGWDSPHYPSDLESVISVGASTPKNQRLYLSNYGHNLSLLAPGSGIMTTKPNNQYGESSGTSLATPFVSAAAAMLLEVNPKLTTKQIRSILESTATPLNSLNRNAEEGAGLLNIHSSLVYPYPTELSIAQPQEFQVFQTGKDKDIVVIGTVASPLFDSYSIKLEHQLTEAGTDNTYPVYTSTEQKINDTLAIFRNIGRPALIDNSGKPLEAITGEMRLTLTLTQKNGKTIEKPILIEIFNQNEALKIDSSSLSNIYFGQNEKYVVGIKTNLSSFARVEVFMGDELVNTFIDDDVYTRHHSILIDNLIDGLKYSIKIITYRRNGETVSTTKELIAEIGSFQFADFADKNYSGLPAAYMMNQVADIDKDGKQEIMLCDYRWGDWRGTQIYKFDNNRFNLIENSDSLFLPVGFGNINGNAATDILAKRYGDHRVLEVKDGKYLQNQLYRDEKYRTALALFDMDKDGKDEIICHSALGFDVVKEQNGKYNTIASTEAIAPMNLSTSPGLIVADFDNDGKNEIVHSNRNDNIVISEFENNSFKSEYQDSTAYPSDIHFIEKADLDADGIPEIVFVTMTDMFQSPEPSNPSLRETKVKLWKMKVYKSIAANKYLEVKALSKEFWGPRAGDSGYGFYKNGISSGNINKSNGDELVLSLYPNLYIFTYDSGKLIPFHHRNDAFANAAMIYDFDGNGINEIVYSAFDTTKSIEYIAKSEAFIPPSQVWGWAIDKDNYKINWAKPNNSISTQIWQRSLYNLPDRLLAETEANTYTLTQFTDNPGLIYLKSKYAGDKVSYPSKTFLFYAKDAIAPTKVIPYSSGIKVTFSGRVAYKAQPEYFKIISPNNEYFYPLSAVYAGEDSYILDFPQPLVNGAYQLQIASFFDYYTDPSKSLTLPFAITNPPIDKELYLKSLNVISTNPPAVSLKYSDAVGTMATDISNYTLSPIGTITGIRFSAETDSTVIIDFADNDGIGALGKEYFITAKNIKNKSGDLSMTTGLGSTMSFVMFADAVNAAFVYPNPIRSTDETLPVFANLPKRAYIMIYTLDGILLNTLQENDANGGTEWNLCDSNGNKLNSGVYLYKVTDFAGNSSELKKFVIVK